MTGSYSQNKSHGRQQESVDRVVDLAGTCLLAYLRREETDFCQRSADFLLNLEMLWRQQDINPEEVWEELNERIALSEKLLKRGIRARKGGPYRSTKLP